MISMTIRHSLSVSGFPISVSSCFIVTVFTACQFYTQSMFLLNLSLCSFNLLFSFIFYPFHFLYSLVLMFSTHSNGLGTRTPPSFCSGLPGRPGMISSDDHNYNGDDHTDDDGPGNGTPRVAPCFCSCSNVRVKLFTSARYL